MSKIIITISDDEHLEDNVLISTEFVSRPLDEITDENSTSAECLAAKALMYIHSEGDKDD